MIITRTPLRVSLVGGGSDLPGFYRAQAGAVLSMAINKYFYLNLHPNFHDGRYLLKYSRTEDVAKVEDIQHTIIRAVFEDYGVSGVDFASAADVPAGTGLGSSSAFTVGLLQLIHAHQRTYQPQSAIAAEACRVEIDRLGNPIGKQDQYGVAIGGLKFIEFNPDDTVTIEPLFLRPDERAKLEHNLLLFYLGNQRSASKILAEQGQNVAKKGAEFETLAVMAEQARNLKTDIMSSVDAVGHYLREAWESKRRLASSISSGMIDEAHRAAMGAGAAGAKLLGAGGGGFLLVYAAERDHEAVRGALRGFPLHRVKIDTSVSIVIYDDRTS